MQAVKDRIPTKARARLSQVSLVWATSLVTCPGSNQVPSGTRTGTTNAITFRQRLGSWAARRQELHRAATMKNDYATLTRQAA